jgi:hypothetical protein
MPHKRLATLLFLLSFALPTLAAVTGSVMTAEGKPLAGARVSLYASESGAARRARLLSAEPEAVPLSSTQTDAKGAFSLESPKAPVADLRVAMRGYAPTLRRVERDEEALAIVLTKAEPQIGTVTAGGKPVAGAAVVSVSGGAEIIAKTNEKGEYESIDPKFLSQLIVLHPEYALDFESFGFGSSPKGKLARKLIKGTPVTGRVVGADGKTPVANAALTIDDWPLAVSAEDGSFTIANAPAQWTTLAARKDSLLGQRVFVKGGTYTMKLDKAAVFTGRILDAKTRLPISGATVRLAGRRFGPVDSANSIDVDAKGMYSLTSPAGNYMLSVSHPGYDFDSADVGGTAGQQSNRDFLLQPQARVVGVVVDEANRPVAAATVIPEVNVDPFQMRGGRMMRETATTFSGPDGKFQLRTTGDREMKIRASRKGLPAGRSEAMKIAMGERKSGVVVTLPSGIEVTGKVTDRDGNALSGASVAAGETPGRGAEGGMQRRMIMIGGPQGDDESVQTGSDGSFSMRLKEGVYDFSVSRDGFAGKVVRAHTVSAAGTQSVEAVLDPAVEISGRITRNGVGVSGVMLFAMGANSSTTTGPDGSFVIGNLSPGPVTAFLSAPNEFVSEQRMFTAPSRDVLIELPAGGRVSGRVVEKGTSKAITAFDAGITRSRGGGPMMMMGPPQTKSFTSDDGSFVLENVPAGAATIVANAPGFVGARLNITVEEGKSVDDLVLELDTGVKLVGKVTGPTGQGLSDVTVRLAPSPTGGFATSGQDKRATTDSNGEYVIDAMSAGDETISFSHAKYPGLSKQVTLKGKETRLDAQMEGAAKTTGVVVTEAGTPVAEAAVYAMGGAGRASILTDASGHFEFDTLSPGRYRFTASRSGYASGVVEDVEVPSSNSVRIVLKTGGTIFGRVTGFSEADLANAQVIARSGNSGAQTTIDSSGNYRLEGAPVGTVNVFATTMAMSSMASRSTATQTVTVSAGSSVQVDLVFRSDVSVRGRVTRDRQPVTNAQVLFMPRNRTTGVMSTGNTDSQGNYSVTGIEDGMYYVSVTDMARGVSYSTEYEVRGGGTFDIDYSSGAIRGRVVDASNNRPISGAAVVARSTTATELFRGTNAVTDENGTFALDGVPAGSYSLTASFDGFGSDTKTMQVGGSGSDTIEFRLSQSEGITLKVVDARSGRAISGSAAVFSQSGVIQENQTMFFPGNQSTTGDLKLPVAPGSYYATVTAFNYAPVTIQVTAPSTRTVALSSGGRIEIESKHSDIKRVQLIDSLGFVYPKTGGPLRRWELIPRVVTPLNAIASGTYTLQLLGPDDRTVVDQKQVTVLEGQTVKVDF